MQIETSATKTCTKVKRYFPTEVSSAHTCRSVPPGAGTCTGGNPPPGAGTPASCTHPTRAAQRARRRSTPHRPRGPAPGAGNGGLGVWATGGRPSETGGSNLCCGQPPRSGGGASRRPHWSGASPRCARRGWPRLHRGWSGEEGEVG